MYKFIRNFHLFLGLLVTPFLLIYAISAAFYSHHFLNISSTETKIENFSLASVSNNPAEIADTLSKKYNIKGTLKTSSLDDEGNVTLNIHRPGVFYEIVVDKATGSVSSKQETQDAIGFIEALHQAGFRGKVFSNASWWSLAIKIVSIFLLFIVITGVVLWIYRIKDRFSGGLFLFLNIVYCISLLFVLRLG